MKSIITLLAFATIAACGSGHQALKHSKVIGDVKSLHDLRFEGVAVQQANWSCGAACLATYFREGFGHVVPEQELLEDVIHLENKSIDGLSVADLAELVKKRGYHAFAREVDSEQLAKINLPVIIRLNMLDGGHFVVLKARGIVKTRRMTYALIVDPSGGNRRLPYYQLLAQFLGKNKRGTALLIQRPDQQWVKASSLFHHS